MGGGFRGRGANHQRTDILICTLDHSKRRSYNGHRRRANGFTRKPAVRSTSTVLPGPDPVSDGEWGQVIQEVMDSMTGENDGQREKTGGNPQQALSRGGFGPPVSRALNLSAPPPPSSASASASCAANEKAHASL